MLHPYMYCRTLILLILLFGSWAQNERRRSEQKQGPDEYSDDEELSGQGSGSGSGPEFTETTETVQDSPTSVDQDNKVENQWIPNMSLLYPDQHLLIHFDSHKLFPLPSQQDLRWVSFVLAESWKYLKYSYPLNLNGSDLDLHVVFRKNLKTNNSLGCNYSTQLKSESRDKIFCNDTTVIICGHDGLVTEAWSTESAEKKNLLLSALINAVQYKYLIENEIPDGFQKKPSLLDIMIFDLFKNGLKNEEESQKWLRDHEKKEAILETLEGPKYWLKDWYFPIYSNYGGNMVLDRFLAFSGQWNDRDNNSFLFLDPDDLKTNEKEENKNSRRTDVQIDMNVGEIVHVWSKVAETNLRDFAVKVFGWNSLYQQQFIAARAKTILPQFKYLCKPL